VALRLLNMPLSQYCHWSGVKMLRYTTFLLVFSTSLNSWADVETSHCKDGEKIIFNCSIKGSKKFASVCEEDHIEYRFGLIGSPEFLYPPPEKTGNDQGNFRYSADRSADYSVSEYSLQFYHQNYSYIVYSGEKRKPNDSVMYSPSIIVWKMNELCQKNCPVRAPHASPEGKIVKTFTCSNSNAGRGLGSLHNRSLPPTDLPIPCMSCP
jgi:hypothetical protein